MKLATATLYSTSPYSQSRAYDRSVPKGERENNEDYRERTWREHCHYDATSKEVYIPPSAFKNIMSEAAKFKPRQIPGQGKATYTKHIEAGVMVTELIFLGIKLDEVGRDDLFLPADGKRGSGKRVWKTYPRIDSWEAEVPFLILDEMVTKSVFEATLEEAGSYIGLGRFRPRNNGFYGRFKVKSITWANMDE